MIWKKTWILAKIWFLVVIELFGLLRILILFSACFWSKKKLSLFNKNHNYSTFSHYKIFGTKKNWKIVKFLLLTPEKVDGHLLISIWIGVSHFLSVIKTLKFQQIRQSLLQITWNSFCKPNCKLSYQYFL